MTFVEDSVPRYVYGAYGSNLDPTRFREYVVGSDDGTYGAHRGSSDKAPTPVIGVRRIRAELYFAGHSQRWGGASAYLSFDDPETEARAYLQTYSVSAQQMADLARQEAWVPSETPVSIPSNGSSFAFAPNSRYGRLVTTDDGIVVLTTSNDLAPGLPTGPYLGAMARGLVGAGISLDDVAGYFDSAGAHFRGSEASTYQSLIRGALNQSNNSG